MNMEMNDDVYYVLLYLNNWDFYGSFMSSAPLPESRKEKYNQIMERYQHDEINGSEVIGSLASWLINFDSNNRKKFIDWVAEIQSRQSIKMTKEEHLKKIQQVFIKVFGDETANEIWFNGTRHEGCSFIVADGVWCNEIDSLMSCFNVTPGLFEKSFDNWRVKKATPNTIVNQNVPEGVRDDCYEIRFIFKDFYHRI